ncbi:phosphopantetheine-binding protein [Amycolatopsis sp. NPDC051102]|uniref:phosphopantetheine-binding protein n=1 Tax=Amycolatopsis sp. NPDC051102 TaxID=3155163 RepID=UPI0034193896
MSSNIAQKVEEIWRAALTVPDGQEDATFFELGGESISAVRIASRIEEELDVWIDVGDLFEDDPNLAALVQSVTAKAEDASAA